MSFSESFCLLLKTRAHQSRPKLVTLRQTCKQFFSQDIRHVKQFRLNCLICGNTVLSWKLKHLTTDTPFFSPGAGTRVCRKLLLLPPSSPCCASAGPACQTPTGHTEYEEHRNKSSPRGLIVQFTLV